MRWTRWVAALSLAVAMLSCGVALFATNSARGSTAAAKSNTASDAHTAKLKRGEYLVKTVGCGDCHTPGTLFGAPDFSRLLSGSELGWQGPWGVSYARNITPDMETGIGNWSEDQIVHAMRTGQRPDGRVLLPPMPYPDFANFTDADAFAIAAYLKSIPAVKHKNPAIVPPGAKVSGSILVFPGPSAWDVPNSTPAAAPAKK